MSFYYLSQEMGLALNDILRRVCSHNKDFSIEDISITWINYKSENKSVFKGFGTGINNKKMVYPASICLLYTSPSPRDLSTSRMPSSA